MTIAVVWQEDELLWCAADTRIVAGKQSHAVTELAAKIFSIPVKAAALGEDGPRSPHYATQYGVVFAGAVSPATLTVANASTLLQYLVRPGDRSDPPRFEEIARFFARLSEHYMKERRFHLGESRLEDCVFFAAIFGWCPHTSSFKVALIEGRTDAGFRVEISFPEAPNSQRPWVVLGSAAASFWTIFEQYERSEQHGGKRIPRRVIQQMVENNVDATVGGSTSLGIAWQHGFELFYSVEPIVTNAPTSTRIFNGLDLDREVGQIGDYLVGMKGIA